MIPYPKLKSSPAYRQTLDKFRGYNHSLRIGNGEFYEMENLTSDDYPVLSVRKKRGCLGPLISAGKGMFYVPGKGLFYVAIEAGGGERLYHRTAAGEIFDITEVDPNKKQFALMGKQLIIAPDMKWVDIDTLATGTLAESWSVTSGQITLKLCDAHGNLYENVAVSPEPPAAPGYHQLWLCTAAGSVGLNQYEPLSSQWVSIEATYVKLTGLGDHYFNTEDGVKISGLTGEAAALNGTVAIRYAGEGELIIPGLLYHSYMQDCSSAEVTIERNVPALDFVVECGNRLWGCKEDTNEIYACKLGDPFNWNCFQGLSTDSWVGNVGTPGEFTGAAVQNGYPVFYKEHCKHKVWPSATGAHQITTATCDGVEKGAQNSIAVLDGAVFYKSVFGVAVDDGGGPVDIGQVLGELRYLSVHGAILDGKYYLNLVDHKYQRHLLVYDITRKMWHREDGPSDIQLVAGDGGIYAGSHEQLWDLTGNTGTPEEEVSWFAVTGDLGLETPEQKYISRLTLRLSLDPGATLEIYAQYDREEVWTKLGQVYGTDLRSFSLPVRPRRCDQLRLKLQGKGMCKIYSITKTLGKGSELG